MGFPLTKEKLDECAFRFYTRSLIDKGILPDVCIDESLLKYSGLDSNPVLQTYCTELVHSVPGFLESLGSALAAFDLVPSAVGLGACVLSIMMEIILKSTSETNDDSCSMIRRVFGEEKASSVRDTMEEYVKRHQMFIRNEQRLCDELRRLEQKLSHDLTKLRNSLLLDGQMSTRGFKTWVNGAFFHLQMLIHEARLSRAHQTEQQAADTAHSVSAAVDLYLKDLDDMLEKYRKYKISITRVYDIPDSLLDYLKNTETGYVLNLVTDCSAHWLIEPFVDHVFSKYEPISGLKNEFLKTKGNLDLLISQHNAFTLPSTA